MRSVGWALLAGVGCQDLELDPTGATETADCAGADEYVAGLAATTPLGRTIALLEAEPAPPDIGDNRWVVEVTDARGCAVSDAGLVVTPWMPLHGHGLSPAVYASSEAEPGLYAVDVFDLIMPGLWEFTIELQDGDAVQFAFCAEG
jgi:YtkA-like